MIGWLHMGSILKNVVAFTGLVEGVPTMLAHELNVNSRAIPPDLVIPDVGGFTISANQTMIVVTRLVGAPDAVNIYVEYWHSYERALPSNQLSGLTPFVVNPGDGDDSSDDGIFNILDYGAIADTDTPEAHAANILAYQLASEDARDAGGGVVLTPLGTFWVTAAGQTASGLNWCIFVPGDNIVYRGLGAGISTIKVTAGQAANETTVLFYANGLRNLGWFDFTIDGNWGAIVGVTTTQAGINQGTNADPTNHGIMLRNVTGARLARMWFRQMYGDGWWMGANDNDDLTLITTDVLVEDCVAYICARNGVSWGAPAHDVTIRDCIMSVIFTTPIDAEPIGLFDGARDVTICNNKLSGWWNGQAYNHMISCVAGDPTAYNQSSAARNWRVYDNDVHGYIIINGAIDLVVRDNRVTTDFSVASEASSPIFINHASGEVTVADNYVYDNTPKSAASGDPHNGSIGVALYSAAPINLQPTNCRIRGNRIHSRKGTHGIWCNSPGGFSINDGTPIVAPLYGTATAITALTLTDPAATWTPGALASWHVVVDDVVAVIADNTDTVLTLVPAYPVVEPLAWFTPLGERAATPAAGDYQITSVSGMVDISENDIDCGYDGNPKGGNGIYIFNDRAGGMIRVRNNNVKNADEWGMIVVGDINKPIQFLEIKGNRFWDDQGAQATMTAAIRIPNADSLNSIVTRIIDDNSVIRGSAPIMSFGSGGTTETWLLADGWPQRWTGYGAPAMAALDGSTYQQLDGVAMSTFYVRVAAAWTAIA